MKCKNKKILISMYLKDYIYQYFISIFAKKNIKNMSKLSDRINKMSESATLAMARLSRELKEQGKDVITLSLENQILTHRIL